MITLSSADAILKSVYLDVITDQINTKTNPFYNMIKKGSENVIGKEVKCATRMGLNGGVGSATETGNLPSASSNKYLQFTADLKNIYGTIELSDKSIRASETSAGALVNVLNAEMEGLLEAAKFNFGRMLYQDGSGLLTTFGDELDFTPPVYTVNSTKNLVEGMSINVYNGATLILNNNSVGVTIVAIDRDNNTVTLSDSVTNLGSADFMTLQQSYNSELYGLEYLFGNSDSLYGLTRADYPQLLPSSTNYNSALTLDAIQSKLDSIEERSGGTTDLILTSYDVRRFYRSLAAGTGTNIDYMNLDGGFKALSYNGIPVVADRFVKDGVAYFLNTEDFKLQQLCDWRWIEGDNGSVLHQMENKPAYQATLVKYANLICTRPMGQAKMYNITA